jgi:molybdopterin synthase catalytic subunit
MAQIMLAIVTSEVISMNDLSVLVQDQSCGAIVTFKGDVRNHDGGKEVSKLTYEIHPTAGAKIEEITASVVEGFDVVKVAIAHRYGQLEIGETAFAVAVSAHHRTEAFNATSALVDEIKARLPIWKHQVFADGTQEWVNTA